MFAAIVPAAGTGSRFTAGEGALPKQYHSLSGRPILAWSVAALSEHPAISSVVIAVSPAMQVRAPELLIPCVPRPEKLQFIVGGDTRQESVRMALEFISAQERCPEFVLVHDAVRPFVTPSMIDAIVSATVARGACTLAIPVSDTLKVVVDDVLSESRDRSNVFAIQTPQAGKLEWLLEGHHQAKRQAVAVTDDASVLEFIGHKVYITRGRLWNLKITHLEDLMFAELIARSYMEFDAKPFIGHQ